MRIYTKDSPSMPQRYRLLRKRKNVHIYTRGSPSMPQRYRLHTYLMDEDKHDLDRTTKIGGQQVATAIGLWLAILRHSTETIGNTL